MKPDEGGQVQVVASWTESEERRHCTTVRLRMRAIGSQLGVLAGLLVIAARANAAPASAGTFGYDAPPECPSRIDFSAAVLTRTQSWLAPTAPFSVTVVIRREPEGLVGRVTFERARQRTERELRADGCAELAQALSLIVAILIDPQVKNSPLPAESSARPPPVYLLVAPAPPPRLPPTPWFAGGVEATLETALRGAPTLGARFLLGLGRGDGSLWASALRVSYAHLTGHEVSPTSDAAADFELDTGRLEGCVGRLADGGLAFEPCLFVDLGRMKATGLHPGGDVPRSEPWAALGLSFRPSWTVARRLVLGASLGLEVPLTRYRFAFTGEPTLAETAVCGLDAGLGLGLRFP